MWRPSGHGPCVPYHILFTVIALLLRRFLDIDLLLVYFVTSVVSLLQAGILAVGRGNQVVEPVTGSDGN